MNKKTGKGLTPVEDRKVKRRMSGTEAEKQFWRSPELLDNLLSYLHVKDVSELLASSKAPLLGTSLSGEAALTIRTEMRKRGPFMNGLRTRLTHTVFLSSAWPTFWWR